MTKSVFPPRIEMPDGSIREGKCWLTTPMDVAKEISQGLANNALISKVRQNEHDSWQKLAETGRNLRLRFLAECLLFSILITKKAGQPNTSAYQILSKYLCLFETSSYALSRLFHIFSLTFLSVLHLFNTFFISS